MPLVVMLTVLVLGLALFVARDAWLQWYYPVRGQLYLRCGEPELAATAWECYLRSPGFLGRRRRPAARLWLSHCYYRLDRLDDAVAQCEAVVADARDRALVGLAQRLRAACLDRLGQPEAAAEARQMTDAALPGNEQSAAAWELEIERLEQEGDLFGALAELERLAEGALLLGLERYQLDLRLRVAKMRLRLGRYEQAINAVEELLARAGLPTELQHDSREVAARAYLALERLEPAERDAEAAFRSSNLASDLDRLTDDCLLLAEVALHRGDFVTAMRNYQRVRECGRQGRWLAALGEGECLRLWGREEEAERAFQQAERELERQPAESRSAALLVAMTHAAAVYRRHPARAAELLEPHLEAVVAEPRLALRLAALGAVVLTGAGRDEEARVRLKTVRAAQDKFAHDRHLMVDLDLTRAEVARLRGRYDEAAELLRRALARPPYRLSLPAVEVRLADVLEAGGDHQQAREALERAAAFDLDLGPVEEARQRLAEDTAPASSLPTGDG